MSTKHHRGAMTENFLSSLSAKQVAFKKNTASTTKILNVTLKKNNYCFRKHAAINRGVQI